MFCPECKAELPDDAKYCIRCGYDFTRIKTPPPDQPSDLLGRLRTSQRTDQPEAPSVSGETLKKGEVFARRYKILSEGTRGGMGVVYKCEDQKLNRTVALKIIHPRLLSSDQAVKRFRQEVSISLELLHKNIVRVHNLDEYEGIEFFAMEWVEGKSLREILNEKMKEKTPFTLEEAYTIISQLSDALQYAHQHTIHRDIKPENILIFGSKDGLQVKLTDFGIAKMLTPAQFTSTSLQMGTPYYMAPEQKTDAAHVDKRADIYAAGVVLFELLTLDNTIGLEMPSEINPDLPKEIDQIIKRAIATKPENRYGDVKELSDGLGNVVKVWKQRVEEERKQAEELRKKKEERLRREAEEAERKRREEERRKKEEEKRRLEELRKIEEERRLSEESKRAEEAERKRKEEEEAKRKKRNRALWAGFAVVGILLLIIFFGYRKSEPPQVVPPIASKEKPRQVSPPTPLPAPSQSSPAPAPKETKPTEAPAPAPAPKEESPVHPKPGSVYKDPFTGVEFVYVRGGNFEMGDNFGDGEADEKPVHEVFVKDFWIGKYEVTQGQWEKVMGNNPSYFKKGDNYPVENVSWNDVQEFIQRLNQRTEKKYRLPTEAEWEYAARSGGKREKWAGTSSESELGGYAWYVNNSGGSTQPVGQKKPNGLGLYDMSGNVWEWCEDRYDEHYYRNSLRENPQGPSTGHKRVLRGGSWGYAPWYLRSSTRNWVAPTSRGIINGFRLVLPSQ